MPGKKITNINATNSCHAEYVYVQYFSPILIFIIFTCTCGIQLILSIRVENSVDPEKVDSSKVSSSGSTVFSKRIYPGVSRTTVSKHVLAVILKKTSSSECTYFLL